MDRDIVWDTVVVGGGPAGMMCAGRSAERGLSTLLLEKNDTLGKKLLITGGGRCNVTNSEFDNRKLLEKFRDSSKFLFSTFSQWSVKETLDFFHSRGMETKVENELRTFPVSNSAQSVWDVLVENMKTFGVKVRSNSKVVEVVVEEGRVVGVRLASGETIHGKSVVIATGGTSRPETGSTGDGYQWLKDLGHRVIEPTPSLVPVVVRDAWVKRLSGVSLDKVKLTVLQGGEKQVQARGKILFTHTGVSGPTILNMSKDIGELLKYGDVTISLDALPEEDYSTLNTKLQELLREHDKKNFGNALSYLLPSTLAPVVIELSQIAPETKCHSVTREERLKLVNLLKDIQMSVEKLLGVEKAVITSGGISLDEVDFRTMRSRKYENLYLVGDILNIDRPSGGYSLQLCWTTGFVAGDSVGKDD